MLGQEPQCAADLTLTLDFAGWADKLEGQTLENNDGFYKIIRREPFGVVAGIAAYNATLLYFAYKVGAAVAAGNCIIFKASEKTPLGAIALGALVKEAGFPPGVIQIVNGGRDTGALLASHMNIALLSFTGSNPAGKKIQEAAAKSNLKKVILELGGKNPSIIFEDADIAKAVMWTTNGLLILQGQICTSATNAFVQKGVFDEVVEKLKTSYAQFAHVLGKDPMEPTTIDGTLIDRGHFDRVLRLIDEAKSNGGELLVGGQPVAGGKGPLAIQPTIFKNLSKTNPVYGEEIFGPVINVVPFETEEEAIALANDTVFGLAANVYTENLNRALRVSSAAEAGIVSINMPSFPVAGMPFGGWKQSGASFEGGHLGINEYTRVKTVMIAYS
jgi:aldehyde dehydrogenase (NAD+)